MDGPPDLPFEGFLDYVHSASRRGLAMVIGAGGAAFVPAAPAAAITYGGVAASPAAASTHNPNLIIAQADRISSPSGAKAASPARDAAASPHHSGPLGVRHVDAAAASPHRSGPSGASHFDAAATSAAARATSTSAGNLMPISAYDIKLTSGESSRHAAAASPHRSGPSGASHVKGAATSAAARATSTSAGNLMPISADDVKLTSGESSRHVAAASPHRSGPSGASPVKGAATSAAAHATSTSAGDFMPISADDVKLTSGESSRHATTSALPAVASTSVRSGLPGPALGKSAVYKNAQVVPISRTTELPTVYYDRHVIEEIPIDGNGHCSLIAIANAVAGGDVGKVRVDLRDYLRTREAMTLFAGMTVEELEDLELRLVPAEGLSEAFLKGCGPANYVGERAYAVAAHFYTIVIPVVSKLGAAHSWTYVPAFHRQGRTSLEGTVPMVHNGTNHYDSAILDAQQPLPPIRTSFWGDSQTAEKHLATTVHAELHKKFWFETWAVHGKTVSGYRKCLCSVGPEERVVIVTTPPIKSTPVAGRGAPNAPIILDSSDVDSSRGMLSAPLSAPPPRPRPRARGRTSAESTSPPLAATTFRAQLRQEAPDGYSLDSLSLGGPESDSDENDDDADGGFRRALLGAKRGLGGRGDVVDDGGLRKKLAVGNGGGSGSGGGGGAGGGGDGLGRGGGRVRGDDHGGREGAEGIRARRGGSFGGGGVRGRYGSA